MSHHDDDIRIGHMLRHSLEAVSLSKGKSKSDLEKDRLLQLALTRLIEIVGEAAARVAEDTREKYPSVPWADIVGMRNKLIHGYDKIDLNVLWDTVTDDLPRLAGELKKSFRPR
jgi:uncharacterized protein with HEPN domain